MKLSKVVTFLRLLFPYVLILIVVIIFGTQTYDKVLRLSTQETINTQRSILNNTQQVISMRLEEIKNMAIELSYDEQFRMKIIRQDSTGDSNYYNTIETWKTFKDRQKNNEFIFDYFIYFKDKNFIISPNQLSNRVELYYDKFLNYESMSYDDWYETFINQYHNGSYYPASKVTVDNKVHSIITYIHSLPLDYTKGYSAVLMVLIDEEEMKQYFNTYLASKGGWSIIVDENGNIITQVGGEKDSLSQIDIEDILSRNFKEIVYKGDKMLAVGMTSDYNGWRYINVISENVVMDEVNIIKDNTKILTFIIIAILILLSILFAYSNSKPVNKWINRLTVYNKENNNKVVNQYSILDNLINNVIESNTELKEMVEEHMPLVRNAIFLRLINGNFTDNNEFEQLLKGTGIKLKADYYCIGLVKIGGYVSDLSKEAIDELNYNRIIANKIIHDILKDKNYVFYLGDNRLAILFLGEKQDQNKMKTYIDQICNAIIIGLKQYNINVFLALGNVYNDIGSIYRSLEEANKVLDNVIYKSNNRIEWYEEVYRNQETNYYFPMDMENKLINVVKSGNIRETENIIDTLIEENINSPLDSVMTEKVFLYEICGTLYKIYEDVYFEINDKAKLNEILKNINKYSCIENICEYIKKEFMDITYKFGEQKQQKQNKLRDEIIQYIHENYSESSLGLAEIGDRFGLSEVYFSQLFKEQTGKNFSNYIEKLRMKKSKRITFKDNQTKKPLETKVRVMK